MDTKTPIRTMHIFFFLRKKYDLKHLGKNTKITKNDCVLKTKNRTKKSCMQKRASGQFQSTPQIWPLMKKVEFLGAQNAPLGRPVALKRDMM